MNTASDPNRCAQRTGRDVLEGLRREHGLAVGPLAGGLSDSDSIILGSFHNPYVCQRFRDRLASAGIRSTVHKDGRMTVVAVGHGHRERAWRLLAEQQARDPDRRLPGPNRDYDCTFLGALSGALIGLPCWLTLGARSFFLAMITGVITGWIADQIAHSRRYCGHVRFTIRGLLQLTAAVGVLLALWSLI